MRPPRFRVIRQEPKFDEQLAVLGISHKRLDEAMEAVTFGLSHDPARYPIIPGTMLHVIKTPVYPDAPSLRIFFTFDENEVHLIHAEFCDDVSPEMGYQE